MRLNHLLAADALGKPLDEARRLRGGQVLLDVGFVREERRLLLDETFPWVTVEEQDGLWHVHARTPLPEHVFDTATAALEQLLREAGLVRLDALSRREISPIEWARRLSEEAQATLKRGYR